MPAEERDHRGPDDDVERGVQDRGRAAGEERHEAELNGVGDDGDDPRGKDTLWQLLHARTLGSATGGGQPPAGESIIWKSLLLSALLVGSPFAAAEPTRLVIELQPGLPPSANRLVAGAHPWVASVMELVGLDTAGPDIRVVLAPESSPLARAAPTWVSGYTDGVTSSSGSVVVLLAERTPSYPDGGLEEVLAHEVAHVLIHRASNGRPVPRWFDEGLAMLAGRSWQLRDETELALGVLSGPRVPLWKLDDLFRGDRREVEHGYALAGTLVHELLDHYGGATPRLVLARLARGEAFEEAMRGATGATLLDIGEAFYARQATLKRWIPILTSTAALWFGISLLAIVAGIRKRRRRVKLEEEAGEPQSPSGGEEEQPPDETVN